MATFGAAFAAARKAKGPGKTFTWKGKLYTTDRADDKPAKKAGGTDVTSSPRPRANPKRPPQVMSEAPELPAQSRAKPLKRVGVKTGKLVSLVSKALDRADGADAANKTRDELTKAEWDKLQERRKKSRGDRMYTSAQ